MADKKNSENGYARLHRSATNKYLGGVAGGLGEYFNIDPTLIRIIFIILAAFGGSGFLVYLILWLILPAEHSAQNAQDNIRDNVDEMREKAEKFAEDIRLNHHASNKSLWGLLVLGLGVLFLLDSFGIYSFSNISRLWPILLIIVGLSIISKK